MSQFIWFVVLLIHKDQSAPMYDAFRCLLQTTRQFVANLPLPFLLELLELHVRPSWDLSVCVCCACRPKSSFWVLHTFDVGFLFLVFEFFLLRDMESCICLQPTLARAGQAKKAQTTKSDKFA